MKKALTAIIFVLFSALFCSCSPEQNNGVVETGSICIVFENAVRGIEPTISLEASKYQIIFSGPDGRSEELLLSSGSTEVSKNNFAVGEWSVLINALNSSGRVIGSGSDTLSVKANKTSSANITITELEGEGTLTIYLEGENPDELSYSLSIYRNEKGTDTLYKTVDFALDGSSVMKAQAVLPNGFYLFKIVSSSSGSITCYNQDTVRIVNGDSLSGTYTIKNTENGNVTISINNAIARTPSLVLYLSSSDICVGDSVTITLRGLEGERYKYEWYLDKKKIEGDSNSVILFDLSFEGEYEVCCIVRDTESGLIWSQSKCFVVTIEKAKKQTLTLSGEVEFYLASDVLMYYATSFKIKNKVDGSVIVSGKHDIYTFPSETEIYAELYSYDEYDGFDEYTYYLEQRYISEENRTLVYVVVDKEIDDYGYVTVHSGDIGSGLDPDYNSYLSKVVQIIDKCIPYLPYNDTRTLKMEAGTYYMNYWGTNSKMLNGRYQLSFDKDRIDVVSGKNVELTLGQKYVKADFKNSLFEKGSQYKCFTLLSNKHTNSFYAEAADDGVLTLVISLEWDYDELVIWDKNRTGFYRVSLSELEGKDEIDAVFAPVAYKDSNTTIPSGRLEFETVSDNLIPGTFREIIWRLCDKSGNPVEYGNPSLWKTYFTTSTETTLSYYDLFETGYDIKVSTSKKEDEKGAYTLVTLNLYEEVEKEGTLQVQFDISDFDMSLYDNRTAVYLRNKDTGSYYYIFMKSDVSQTLTVEPGTYFYYSCWRQLMSSDGTYYSPVNDPETFTVKEGETTQITVRMKQQDY